MELNDDWLSWPPEAVAAFSPEFPAIQTNQPEKQDTKPRSSALTNFDKELRHAISIDTFL